MRVSNKKTRREKDREVKMLKETYPNVDDQTVKGVYKDYGFCMEKAAEILSTLAAGPSLSEEAKFLEDMFEGTDIEYIQDVLVQCNNDLEKTTAFLLEVGENSEESDEFGNDTIGFASSTNLRQRQNQSYLEMLYDMYPEIPRTQVDRIYNNSGENLVKALRTLDQTLPEVPSYVPPPREEFPSLAGSSSSQLRNNGYWGQHASNDPIHGRTVTEVEDINNLRSFFPTLEPPDMVNSVYIDVGRDFNQALNSLKNLFPEKYRSIPTSRSSPSIKRTTASNPPSPPKIDFRLPPPMNVSEFQHLNEQYTRCTQAHKMICQAASRSYTHGGRDDSNSLRQQSKRLKQEADKAYQQIYLEIFRRNNPEFDSLEEIDLHMLRVKEAVEITLKCIALAQQKGKRTFRIITGKGLHSEGGYSRIKRELLEVLRTRRDFFVIPEEAGLRLRL